MAATHEQAIPRKLSKRLAGECQHCKEPAIEGSDFCAVHDAHEKGQQRARKARHRLRLAEVGLCIVAGCGAKVGKRLRPDGRPVLRRCKSCGRKHRDESRARRGVTDDAVVYRAEEPATTKLEVGKDGATRTRYVPRAGQGAPSREETDRRLLRDLREGAGHLQRLVTRWPPPRDEIAALPRIQRTEAWDQVAEPMVQAIRLTYGVVAALPTSWGEQCPCCGSKVSSE